VYRRITNFPGHFDHDSGKPDLAAFAPNARAPGVISADLDIDAIVASLEQPPHAGFGFCALDIARMANETSGRAWVEYAPAGSETHVRIHGCADLAVQAILADVAEVIQPPRRRA
jgi:hypothetical protein